MGVFVERGSELAGRSGRAVWLVAGGIVTWAVIHFGLLNWLGDAHHPWRPIVEGVSWVAGIGASARKRGCRRTVRWTTASLWRLETTGEKNEVLLVSVDNGLVLDATFEVSGDIHPAMSVAHPGSRGRSRPRHRSAGRGPGLSRPRSWY